MGRKMRTVLLIILATAAYAQTICVPLPMGAYDSESQQVQQWVIEQLHSRHVVAVPCDANQPYQYELMYYLFQGWSQSNTISYSLTRSTLYFNRPVFTFALWTVVIRPRGSPWSVYRHRGYSLKGELKHVSKALKKVQK